MKGRIFYVLMTVVLTFIPFSAVADQTLPNQNDLSFRGFALSAGPIGAYYLVPDVDLKWEISGDDNIKRNLQETINDQMQYGLCVDGLYFGKKYLWGSVGFQIFFPGGDPKSKVYNYEYNLTGIDEVGKKYKYRIGYSHRFNFNLAMGGYYPVGRFEFHGGAELLLDYAVVRIHWQGAKPVGYDSEDESQGSFLFAVAPLAGGGVFLAPHFYLGVDGIYAIGMYQSMGGRVNLGYQF